MTRSIPDAESMTVEFKSDRGPLSDHDLLLAVVCLANTEGGDLCLGVEDDGRVTGLHSSHQNVSTLAAMFANRTSPPVGVRVAAFDANLPFLQMIVEEEGRTGTSLPVDALIALGELRDERRASSAQIARAIQRDDATAKRVAERLVEAGIVEAQGNTRART